LGAAAAATQNPAASNLMQMPAATQLSHAAALAAATSQFYEYQVSLVFLSLFFKHKTTFFLGFLGFSLSFFISTFDFVKIYLHEESGGKVENCKKNFETNFDFLFFLSLQNALAATAAPFPGQYSGFEAYPYAAAATGESLVFKEKAWDERTSLRKKTAIKCYNSHLTAIKCKM
jgi:hypothetical protein